MLLHYLTFALLFFVYLSHLTISSFFPCSALTSFFNLSHHLLPYFYLYFCLAICLLSLFLSSLLPLLSAVLTIYCLYFPLFSFQILHFLMSILHLFLLRPFIIFLLSILFLLSQSPSYFLFNRMYHVTILFIIILIHFGLTFHLVHCIFFSFCLRFKIYFQLTNCLHLILFA